MIKNGEIIRFPLAWQYGIAATIVSVCVAIAIPALARYDLSRGLYGGLWGAGFGYVGFTLNESLITSHFIATSTALLRLFAYLAIGMPVAIGAVMANVKGRSFQESVKLLIVCVGVSIVFSIFPFINMAANLYKTAGVNADFYYVPIITLIIWGIINYMESK